MNPDGVGGRSECMCMATGVAEQFLLPEEIGEKAKKRTDCCYSRS